MTLAASAFPTPASPSMKSGFSICGERKCVLARARSPMYLRSRKRASISSMLVGARSVTRKGYEGGGPARAPGPQPSLLRLLDGPLGEHPGQVLLVLRTRTKVARWVQAVRRVLRRVFRSGAVVKRLFDRLGADRRRSHVGQADAPAPVHLLRGGADDR